MFKLGHKEFTLINQHISEKILSYLEKKYPLTLNSDINKALEKELHEANNLDLLENDILYQHKIVFKYREDGNYNDMIMVVINKVMEIIDSKSPFAKS